MNTTLLVSIILPVYNVAEFLPVCLDSLLRQTYNNIEIICIDDGSTDHCLAVLKEFAGKDRRIRVLRQDNEGVGAARNRGLEAAMGACVAFVDSDDWVDARYIEILMRGILEYKADVSSCSLIKVKELGETREINTAAASFTAVSPQVLLDHWSLRRMVTGKIYRKEILSGHSFQTEIRRSEDTLFNLDVICHAEDLTAVFIDLPLYYYYLREDSVSHQVKMSEALGVSQWYAEHADRIEQTGYEWVFRMTAVKLALSSRYYALFEENGSKTKKEANAVLRKLIPGMLSSIHTPFRIKMSHLAMSCMPDVYRLWRLLNDPTLLELEKKRRLRRRSFSP